MFRGFLFDLDGTVYLGDRLIPGADQAIRRLREKGKKVVFLSNKSIQTREDYASKLTRLGIPTRPDEVVNSTRVMIHYLKTNAPRARVFVVGEPPFVEEVRKAGFVISEDPREIDYVIVGFDRTFNYRKLNIAFQAIKRGARLVATNPDRTCPVEEGEIPDCAAMIAAIEAVTRQKVEAIVGKPAPWMLQLALDVMGLHPQDCILIGDRLETDIQMGKNSGLATGLVLSGVTDEKTLRESSSKPDYIFKSIADIETLQCVS